jgi:hypothetical protein
VPEIVAGTLQADLAHRLDLDHVFAEKIAYGTTSGPEFATTVVATGAATRSLDEVCVRINGETHCLWRRC